MYSTLRVFILTVTGHIKASEKGSLLRLLPCSSFPPDLSPLGSLQLYSRAKPRQGGANPEVCAPHPHVLDRCKEDPYIHVYMYCTYMHTYLLTHIQDILNTHIGLYPATNMVTNPLEIQYRQINIVLTLYSTYLQRRQTLK